MLIFVLAVGAVVVLADAYIQTYRVYNDAKAVLPNLERARTYLAKGLIPPGDPFLAASRAAQTAQDDIDNARFTFRLVDGLPFFKRPIEAVKLGVTAAREEALAATGMRDLVSDVLGPTALSGSVRAAGQKESTPIFHNGVVNVGLLASLAPRLEAVVGHLQSADNAIRAIPPVPYVHRLSDLKAQAIGQSNQAIALARNALSSARLLPGFFGADGPRTYLLALQNNDDLRAPGGEMAAYALATFNKGALKLVASGGVHDIRVSERNSQIFVRLDPAVSWYVRNVPKDFSWINGVNYTPNFPLVADAWARMTERATSRPVDGVIAFDPFAIASLIGNRSLHVPVWPVKVTAQNLVSIVEYQQYSASSDVQFLLPRQLVRAALPILTDVHPLVRTVKAYGQLFRTKRVQMWAARPEEQALIQHLGWDGAIRVNRGDYLYMVDNKVIPNKVDWYARTGVNYQVQVFASGAIRSDYSFSLDNTIAHGPARPAERRRTNVAYMSLYVPHRAKALALSPREGLPTHAEHENLVFTRLLTVPPESTGVARYEYSVPGVIQQTSEGKVYQLTIQHQPLAKPTAVTVVVRLPPGSHVKLTSPGWTVTGTTATLHVTLTRDLVTRIVF